ncbi:diacylglycerol kinase [Nitrosomonas sp. JL21]|uniref:diacylglycerol/lipid kinase family protein n=1 Tax=Nitrosomonas sp. JL21 TaxID=153949 RepID=UPI00136A300A|nr:diacylglycerol kinase family protein [Nitrosomonas sp. JL21]MBL8497675.1 diacylglycerol kinase [Nitrosomonas sp.]MXS78381.1 diacylglycerol kinase [Nitrosomonas sp. JL21]
MTLQARIERLHAGTAKVGCLLNPLSGQVRKRMPAIQRGLDNIPGLLIHQAQDAASFKTAITQLLKANIDVLVIIAGDGTTHAILGHLFAALTPDQWPLVMIIPGGTTNMTPLDLGARDKPDRAIERLHDFLLNPTAPGLVDRPVLRIEQRGIGAIYGMFFAVGLIARGVKFSRSPVKQIGVTGSIFTALIMFRSLIGMISGMLLGRQHSEWAPVELTLTQADGSVQHGTYLFALVSALDCLLLNLRPYWGQEQAPLHVTLVDQHPRRLWRSLWPLLSGKGRSLTESDGYHSHNMDSLTLYFDDEFIVDGELYHSESLQEPLRISATHPITFLVLKDTVNIMTHSIPGSAGPLPIRLLNEVAWESNKPVSPDLIPVVDSLIMRFGESVEAVMLYGSCLHSDISLDEGIVDLYVVVDSYYKAYQQRYLANLNTWLAPNVFYLEIPHQGKMLRAKYAVISIGDFEQGAQFWFHPYIWARFAQPSRLLYSRNNAVKERINSASAHSVVTFLKSGVPALEAGVYDVKDIWTRCLTLTYAAELRAEKESRAHHLALVNLSAFTRLTEVASPMLTGILEKLENGKYRCLSDPETQRKTLWLWRLRRWQGRVLSILRLAKATLTFNNSVEYAAWKIERHTGVQVKVTPTMRRYPILWGLTIAWELLRRGVLR